MTGQIIKVTLEKTQPPIWRRVVIPNKISLEDLSDIILCAYDLNKTDRYEYSFPNESRVIVLCSEDSESLTGKRSGNKDVRLAPDSPVEPYFEEYGWIRLRVSDDKGNIISFRTDPEKTMEWDHRYAFMLKAVDRNITDTHFNNINLLIF